MDLIFVSCQYEQFESLTVFDIALGSQL